MQRQTKKTFDCSTCEDGPPTVSSDNRLAVRLYQETITQRKYGYGGVLLGMDYTAVISYADKARIPLDPMLLNKLRMIEIWELERAGKNYGK
jgi:hypothetical protein